MIYGIGTDIVELKRIEESLTRHPEIFAKRMLSANEFEAFKASKQQTSFLAGRWAAKEAVAKAFGTGFGGDCGWTEIEIINGERGKPDVTLLGCANAFAASKGITRIHLSISHEKQFATAMAVAETEEN